MIDRAARSRSAVSSTTTGGLPGPINHAYAGNHRWDRAEGEELESFVQRSAYAGIEAGEMALNVGGLPRGDELDKFATFEDWWASIAEHYPEVPDPEPAGYQRLASKW